jgi:hypothetical protein
MIKRLVRRTWVQLQIAFNDRYTPEGFERTERKFECPEDSSQLDSRAKKALTICNLFANQNLSIWSIARVLDVSPGKVIVTLIEQGLIKERRVRRGTAKNDKRQKLLSGSPSVEFRLGNAEPGRTALQQVEGQVTDALKSEMPFDPGSKAPRRIAI